MLQASCNLQFTSNILMEVATCSFTSNILMEVAICSFTSNSLMEVATCCFVINSLMEVATGSFASHMLFGGCNMWSSHKYVRQRQQLLVLLKIYYEAVAIIPEIFQVDVVTCRLTYLQHMEVATLSLARNMLGEGGCNMQSFQKYVCQVKLGRGCNLKSSEEYFMWRLQLIVFPDLCQVQVAKCTSFFQQ